MAKNIIVSNRLPVQITKLENSYVFNTTSGGLATGMDSVHQGKNSLWIGWPGIACDSIDDDSYKPLINSLKKLNYYPVSLNKKEIDDFYYGLPNKCIWPLFHYFIEFSRFDEKYWDSYVEINKKFSEIVINNIEKGDIVWIHDYQLLLCPKMIKDIRPDVTIGFFLHIPFPSFEIFRIFPWRVQLIEGILGADLIGFHTYDYQRHFLSSVKRILKYEVSFNKVSLPSREVTVNTFPMGIDYNKFHDAANDHMDQKNKERSELKKQLELHRKGDDGGKLILSIDRLDYTKGVINRIKAFDVFLTDHPEYREKVRLVMLTVPSRSDVPEYKKLKKETDEIVGRINGKHATVNWTPIWYYYRAMDFEDLIDLYMTSDIAMISPVRDGMNLVAKEFIATRVNLDGVLILSEMAGASKELFEALLVNPFDLNSMADSIYKALTMSLDEQKERNRSMQKRLRRYTVQRWANEFMRALNSVIKIDDTHTIKIDTAQKINIKKSFENSSKRLIIIDYDGTLVEFNENPELAIPDENLINLIKDLNKKTDTHVAIVSGRDKKFLNKWFGKIPITLIAEHGHYQKVNNEDWTKKLKVSNLWMEDLIPLFETFTDRTPGTFIEKKKNSLVWHYRKSDPELASDRVVEFKTVLTSLISEELQVLDLNKAIEIISVRINKGVAISELFKNNYDLIICIGDDISDEYMFNTLPEDSFSIKVGNKNTNAKYYIQNPLEVRKLLKSIIN
jgi:trehalose 6-phosphate synthase/phosphatase